MNDLNTLRPEVAEAIRLFGAVIEELGLHDNYESALHVLCAELLRLAEYEQAAGRLAVEKAEFRQRAEKAEAELAALKARIAEAQECGVVALCGGGASLSHEPYPSLVGKRVRLVVENDNG